MDRDFFARVARWWRWVRVPMTQGQASRTDQSILILQSWLRRYRLLGWSHPRQSDLSSVQQARRRATRHLPVSVSRNLSRGEHTSLDVAVCFASPTSTPSRDWLTTVHALFFPYRDCDLVRQRFHWERSDCRTRRFPHRAHLPNHDERLHEIVTPVNSRRQYRLHRGVWSNR